MCIGFDHSGVFADGDIRLKLLRWLDGVRTINCYRTYTEEFEGCFHGLVIFCYFIRVAVRRQQADEKADDCPFLSMLGGVYLDFDECSVKTNFWGLGGDEGDW